MLRELIVLNAVNRDRFDVEVIAGWRKSEDFAIRSAAVTWWVDGDPTKTIRNRDWTPMAYLRQRLKEPEPRGPAGPRRSPAANRHLRQRFPAVNRHLQRRSRAANRRAHPIP